MPSRVALISPPFKRLEERLVADRLGLITLTRKEKHAAAGLALQPAQCLPQLPRHRHIVIGLVWPNTPAPHLHAPPDCHHERHDHARILLAFQAAQDARTQRRAAGLHHMPKPGTKTARRMFCVSARGCGCT